MKPDISAFMDWYRSQHPLIQNLLSAMMVVLPWEAAWDVMLHMEGFRDAVFVYAADNFSECEMRLAFEDVGK